VSGLAYPPQPCGLPYKEFRSGWSFRDAYEHVAWARGDEPRTVTQRTVVRELAKLKRAEFQRYQDDCAAGDEGEYADEGDTSFDFSGLGAQKKFAFMRKPEFKRRHLTRRQRERIERLQEPKQCSVHGEVTVCDDGKGFVRALFGSRTSPLGELVAEEIGVVHDTAADCGLVVIHAAVDLNAMDRGVGTKLYTALAQYARRRGCSLASDKTRSVFSEAFWRKQQRKGRARCQGKGGNYYPEPLSFIRRECFSGRLAKATCDRVLDKSRFPEPDGHAWPCRRWVLNFPPPESLAGARKKHRRRA